MSADRLVVALDTTDLGEALRLARRLRGVIRTVKVGSALFTACGPAVIQRLRTLGFDIMLDLKFFDIPSTVELSCRAAVRHRVSMLTVHASGEPAMLEAAVHGVRAEAGRLQAAPPLVLGVTILTSVGAGRGSSVKQRVVTLARQSLRAGCDGVVASAQEAATLRRRFGKRLRIVCPGIRPARAARSDRAARFVRSRLSRAKSRDDQHRTCTPREALRRGADFLVIGRPITAARDPRAAVRRILSEMEVVNGC